MSQKQHVWMFELVLKPHFTTHMLTNPSTMAFSLNIPLQVYIPTVSKHRFCVTSAFFTSDRQTDDRGEAQELKV